MRRPVKGYGNNIEIVKESLVEGAMVWSTIGRRERKSINAKPVVLGLR